MAEANIKSETIFVHDNLEVMRGIDSECVDLIYLDPPFNTNRIFQSPIGAKDKQTLAKFSDVWKFTETDEAWMETRKKTHPDLHTFITGTGVSAGKSMQSYLIFMSERLVEMKRILKDDGSIYLHCDPTASHYLKMMMDFIFGRKNFRNEIIWSYQRWTGATKNFQRMHDVILFYCKSKNSVFNMQTEPYSNKSKHKGSRISKFTNKGLSQQYTGDTTREKAMRDVWEISYLNSQAKERTGYPTQKPVALLDRIIKASSNEGDLVLDPFCGCATTCVASHFLNRGWIGIDVSHEAGVLVVQRIKEKNPMFIKVNVLDAPPKRTDLGKLPSYKTHKELLYGMQDGRCAGNGQKYDIADLVVDHKIPMSRGGTDHIDNLQLMSHACNSSKGNKTMEEWIAWKRGHTDT